MKITKKTDIHTVEKVVTETVEQDFVIIKLTEDEASALGALCGKVCGYGRGPEGRQNIRDFLTSNLWRSLKRMGYVENEVYNAYYSDLCSGTYAFNSNQRRSTS